MSAYAPAAQATTALSRVIAGAAGPPDEPYDADVVILALDRAIDTIAAMRSALAQTGVTRHVFVVDQGSRPENLALFADAVEGRWDATLVALGQNHGVAGGRNRGTALGCGRVIVGLDNDAEFASTLTLSRLVAALDATPNLAAIGCRIVVADSGVDDLSSWGYARRLLPHAGESFDAPTFVGAGHAIRRIAWNDTGGYDDSLFFCWEEFDFCQRAIARGWRVRYRGDIVIRHKVSAEHRVAWSGMRWFYFVRNRLYVGRKCGASWGGMLPRLGFYLLRALRDGALPQALRGAMAAVRLGRPPDGRRLFVSVGSHSNDAETMPRMNPARIHDLEAAHGRGATWSDETGRATVLETTPSGHPVTQYANGLRNCVGMAFAPDGKTP